MLHYQVISFSINLEFLRIEIFCSARHLVEDFLLDVQQKFSTGCLVAEKQLPTRHPLERVNIYQTSSSRKIALLDVQQNFYWMPSRTFTRRLVDQMIWANFLMNLFLFSMLVVGDIRFLFPIPKMWHTFKVPTHCIENDLFIYLYALFQIRKLLFISITNAYHSLSLSVMQ